MRSTSTVRMLALGLGIAGLLVAGGLLTAAPDRVAEVDRANPADAPSATPPAMSSDRTAPLAVLREWDRARAAAWRQADERALARLYTEGSSAGRADRLHLAAYADRGLRVTGMRMQVASVEVVTASDDRISLVVTDRLASATARGGPAPVELPRDRWSQRRVVLVRVGGQWRMSAVTDQARPAASTAPTSRSSKR